MADVSLFTRLKTRIVEFKWSLITVEPVLFLYMFIYGLSAPTDLALLYRKVCLNMYDEPTCDSIYDDALKDKLDKVQEETSKWGFYQFVMYTIPALLALFIYGSWTDKFSRKIPILFPLIGNLLLLVNNLLQSIAINSSPGWFLLSQLFLGAGGGIISLLMFCFSYISVIVPPESRTMRISIVYGADSLANSISYFISGVTLENTSFEFMYSTCVVINVIIIVYVVFRLKDIKPGDQGQNFIQQSNKEIGKTNSKSQTEFETTGSETSGETDISKTQSSEQRQHNGFSASNENNDKDKSDLSHQINTMSNRDSKFALNEGSDKQQSMQRDNCISQNSNIAGSTEEQAETTDEAHKIIALSNKRTFKETLLFLFDLKHFKESVMVTFRRREGYKSLYVKLLVGIILVFASLHAASILYLFVRHPPLSWSQSLYGYYSGYSTLVQCTNRLFFIPIIKRKYAPRDTLLLTLSLISVTLAQTWLGLSVFTWMVFLYPLIDYLYANFFTCARGFVSTQVEDDEYGKVFAVIALVETIGTLISRGLYDYLLYPSTVEIFAGLAFIISSCLTLIPVSMALFLFIHSRQPEATYVSKSEQTQQKG